MSDVNYRDAVTGEYVTESYADQHPETTVAEAAPETNCGVVPVVIHPAD